MSIENRIGGQRVTGILLGIVLALALVVLTWLVVFPRVFRRNRDRMLTVGAFRKFLMRYNNMTRDISGTERSSWGLLTHIGRRSGRTYQTSLGTCSYRDGFLLPLGYGPHSDWYRNLMAAGAGKRPGRGAPTRWSGPRSFRAPSRCRPGGDGTGLCCAWAECMTLCGCTKAKSSLRPRRRRNTQHSGRMGSTRFQPLRPTSGQTSRWKGVTG